MVNEIIQWNDPQRVMPVAWLDVLVSVEMTDGKRVVRRAYVFPMDPFDEDDDPFQWNESGRDGGKLYGRVFTWSFMPEGAFVQTLKPV